MVKSQSFQSDTCHSPWLWRFQFEESLEQNKDITSDMGDKFVEESSQAWSIRNCIMYFNIY